MREEWKPVLGYEGLYEVSNEGRVRALFKAGNFHKAGRILKPWILRNGYFQVHLMRPGESRPKGKTIHVLVLEAFSGPRPEGMISRHLDGSRRNNRPENLVWGTPKENTADSKAHGTFVEGEKNGRAKLTRHDVGKLRRLWKSGWSGPSLAKLFGVDRTLPWMIATRKVWRSVP